MAAVTWKPTSPDRENDYVAYDDGDELIGRVHRLANGQWRWVMFTRLDKRIRHKEGEVARRAEGFRRVEDISRESCETQHKPGKSGPAGGEADFCLGVHKADQPTLEEWLRELTATPEGLAATFDVLRSMKAVRRRFLATADMLEATSERIDVALVVIGRMKPL